MTRFSLKSIGLVCLMALLAVLATPAVSQAGNVLAGYDLFATVPPTNFDGVAFIGEQLGTYNFGGTIGTLGVGNADTIIQRTQPTGNVAAPGGPADVNIQFGSNMTGASGNAFQLRSLNQTSLPGIDPTVGFYWITLQSARTGPSDPAAGPTSTGKMAIDFTTDTSGSFASSLDVFFDIRLGTATDPGLGSNNIVFSSDLTLSQGDLSTGKGAAWSTTPPPLAVLIPGVNYQLNGTNTNDDFWPGPLTESHPTGAQHSVDPATLPEPSSLTLLSLGALGLAGFLRRRRRAA